MPVETVDLIPVITQAGLAAAFNAQSTGLDAEITHLALGDANYTPDATQAGLVSEQLRIPVASGSRVAGTQIHVEAMADGDTEFWVRELGFVLSDGTFLTIWSHPTQPLAYKSAVNPLYLLLDFVLDALPADTINVVGTDNWNLFLAEQFAKSACGHIQLATSQLRTMLQQIKLNDRLRTLEG